MLIMNMNINKIIKMVTYCFEIWIFILKWCWLVINSYEFRNLLEFYFFALIFSYLNMNMIIFWFFWFFYDFRSLIDDFHVYFEIFFKNFRILYVWMSMFFVDFLKCHWLCSLLIFVQISYNNSWTWLVIRVYLFSFFFIHEHVKC